MKITAQNGKEVDARAAEVYKELGKHSMFSNDEFEMPQE